MFGEIQEFSFMEEDSPENHQSEEKKKDISTEPTENPKEEFSFMPPKPVEYPEYKHLRRKNLKKTNAGEPKTKIEPKDKIIPKISKKQDILPNSTKTPEKENRGTYFEIIQDGMHIVTNDSRQKGPIVTVFYGKETTEPITIPKKENTPIRTRQVVSSVDSLGNEGDAKNIKVIKIIDINRNLREK